MAKRPGSTRRVISLPWPHGSPPFRLDGQTILARLDDGRLVQDFEFLEGDSPFSLPREVQMVQLFGHDAYHRGQVALLVDQLGGETVDTDYVDWWWANRKDKR